MDDNGSDGHTSSYQPSQNDDHSTDGDESSDGDGSSNKENDRDDDGGKKNIGNQVIIKTAGVESNDAEEEDENPADNDEAVTSTGVDEATPDTKRSQE